MSTPIRGHLPSTPTHTRSLCNEMDGYSFLGQYSHYPLSFGGWRWAALRVREVLSQLVPTSVAEKEEERPRSGTQRPKAEFVHSWIRFCNPVAAGVVATLQFVVYHIKCLYYKSLSSLSRATKMWRRRRRSRRSRRAQLMFTGRCECSTMERAHQTKTTTEKKQPWTKSLPAEREGGDA